MNSLKLLLGLPLALCACSALTPVKDTATKFLLDSTFPPRTPTASSPALAVAPPALPPYLDRQQIVTRTPEGQLRVYELQLWSEPLSDGIARVLSENLRRLTGSTTIQPVGDFITLDYKALVEIHIAQFDPGPPGVLVLRCTWKVQPVDGVPTSYRAFRTEVQMDSTLPSGGRVPAMNEALARLSRTIANSL